MNPGTKKWRGDKWQKSRPDTNTSHFEDICFSNVQAAIRVIGPKSERPHVKGAPAWHRWHLSHPKTSAFVVLKVRAPLLNIASVPHLFEPELIKALGGHDVAVPHVGYFVADKSSDAPPTHERCVSSHEQVLLRKRIARASHVKKRR